MPEYNYDVVLHTPLGDKTGKLTLRIEPPTLRGIFTFLGHALPCSGRIDRRGRCTLRGQIMTFMSVIDYFGSGYADSGRVDIKLSDRESRFRMTGTTAAAEASDVKEEQ